MSYPEVAIGRIGGLSHRNCERLQMERVWDGGEFADNFGVRRLVGGQNQSTMFDGTRHAATDAVELGVEHDADGMALAIRYATNRNGEDAKHAMLTDVAFRLRPFVADVEHTP